MRCRKARQRLIECGGSVTEYETELLEHLHQCRACAKFAQAEQTLMRDMLEATSIREEVVPLTIMKMRVESHVYSQSENKSKETSIMSLFANNFKKRSRLSISLGIAVIILALVTLVPFTIEDKIGYEVAIAGVDKDLAMDSVKVEELLVKLGLDDASFNVSGCDQTCNLKISKLKSEDDAKIIVTAFNELDNCVVKNISEVYSSEKGTIIDKAKNVFFYSSDKDSEDEYDFDVDADSNIYEIVISDLNELNEAHDGTFSIWISKDGDSDNVIIEMLADSCVFLSSDDSDDVMTFFNNNGDSAIGAVGDSIFEVLVITDDGQEHPINMKDEDAQEQLKKLGIEDIRGLTFNNDEDSMLEMRINQLSTGEQENIISEPNLGDESISILINQICKDSIFMIIDSKGGQVHKILLNGEDAIEQLKALGVNIEYVMNDDSTFNMIYYSTNDNDNENLAETFEDFGTDEHILKESTTLPEGYDLSQNSPNPFNPSTQISFTIPETQHVSIRIFNLQGQRVSTLVDRVMDAGEHVVEWDATDDNGNKLSSGVYLYRFIAGNIVVKKKMTLLK